MNYKLNFLYIRKNLATIL